MIIYSYFCLKHRMWVTPSNHQNEAVLTRVPTTSVLSKNKKKVMYTHVNLSFTINVGFKGL